MTGTWNVVTQVNAIACGEGTYSESEVYSVTQTDGNLTVSVGGASYSGSISGNNFSWSGSFMEDGGTTTSNMSGTVAANGNSLSGSSSWSWTDGVESCDGSSTFTGTRQ